MFLPCATIKKHSLLVQGQNERDLEWCNIQQQDSLPISPLPDAGGSSLTLIPEDAWGRYNGNLRCGFSIIVAVSNRYILAGRKLYFLVVDFFLGESAEFFFLSVEIFIFPNMSDALKGNIAVS